MARETPAPWPTRLLGTTGLLVHPLCLGAAGIGSMPAEFDYTVAEEQGLSTVRAFLDSPLNFMDTAASYGDGESERRIGIVLRERGGLPPGKVLATKADRDLATGDFSGDQMRRSVERSLHLLGLERLQLVYLHDQENTTFAAAMAPGGPVEALLRLKDEGLIEHIGLAGGPIDLEIQYLETGAFEVVLSHNRYTLLNVAAEPLWEAARRRGVAAVNAAPYGGGLLARGPDAFPRYIYRRASSAVLERARRIEAICTRHGVPLAAAALQFSLRDPRLVSTIAGIDHPDLLAKTIQLATYPIPDALWAELAAVTPDAEEPR